MAVAFIGLGSNLGDRAALLNSALERIARLPRTRVLQSSSFHETDPVGGPPQGKFLNSVAKIETSLKPIDLFDRLHQIERDLGRKHGGERWGPREIDLDLLDYHGLGLKLPGLELPHPRMHDRLFVLEPLAEIEPEWLHPVLAETAGALLKKLENADRSKNR